MGWVDKGFENKYDFQLKLYKKGEQYIQYKKGEQYIQFCLGH